MQEEKLLDQIFAINREFEQVEKLTGEKFNIFRILKVESNEVRTHSAFIGELLNPKGSHGQNDIFLKEFIKVFKTAKFTVDDCKNSIINKEYYIGKTNEDYTSGGRVDILITSGKKIIVIENKIYAVDCKNQLHRYKEKFPDAEIFYLTLNGDEPSTEGMGGLTKEDYKCTSYSKDIIDWLDICREKSAMLPILREGITQYINLIKHLTHQSINQFKKMEINKLLLESEEKFKSAKSIASALKAVEENIRTNCENDLRKAWHKTYNIENNDDVKLFKFNSFNFYVKFFYYEESFTFALFPKQGIKLDNYANLKELKPLRDIAQSFKSSSDVKFESTSFYSGLVQSKFDLKILPFIEYGLLNNDRGAWVNKIMEEGKEFIQYMVDSLKLLNNDSIEIDNKFLQVKA